MFTIRQKNIRVYVNDIFVAFEHKPHSNKFVHYTNTSHPNITFTLNLNKIISFFSVKISGKMNRLVAMPIIAYSSILTLLFGYFQQDNYRTKFLARLETRVQFEYFIFFHPNFLRSLVLSLKVGNCWRQLKYSCSLHVLLMFRLWFFLTCTIFLISFAHNCLKIFYFAGQKLGTNDCFTMMKHSIS